MCWGRKCLSCSNENCKDDKPSETGFRQCAYRRNVLAEAFENAFSVFNHAVKTESLAADNHFLGWNLLLPLMPADISQWRADPVLEGVVPGQAIGWKHLQGG